MTDKHTPGPWRLWLDDEGAFEISVGDAFEDVRVIASRAGWRHNAEQAIANARLLAAAPDLLVALREVVTNGEWQGGTDWRVSTAVYEMAQDAIAKAEGTKRETTQV